MPIMALVGNFFQAVRQRRLFFFDKPQIDYIFYRTNIKKSRNNNRYYSFISNGYAHIFLFVVKNLNLLYIQAVYYRKEEWQKMTDRPLRERLFRIGVISDTHGYLDARAIDAFAGTDLIIHAGDIGKPKILDALATVSPVRAVRGNTDRGPWADDLPSAALVVIDRVTLYVLHDIQQLDLEPKAAGIRVVISGHTHRASLEEKNNVIFLNPGSALEPRQNSPPTVAILTARGETLDARFIELSDSKKV